MNRNDEMRLISRAMGGNIESREIADGVYQHVAKEAPMTWTTDYPTKPGYYWVRNLVDASRPGMEPIYRRRVVEIIPAPFGGSSLILRLAGDPTLYMEGHIKSAEWYGPIEPPE